MKKPIIILLNGPIGSGKDVIGAELKLQLSQRNQSCELVSFKAELQKDISSAYKLPLAQVQAWNERDEKELPRVEYGGKSSRQAHIHISEDVIKPLYGKSIYGYKLGDHIMTFWPRPDYVVATDSGFTEEFLALVDSTRAAYQLFIVKLARKGCSYGPNDSRNYIQDAAAFDLGVPVFWVRNDGLIRDAAEDILAEVDRRCR